MKHPKRDGSQEYNSVRDKYIRRHAIHGKLHLRTYGPFEPGTKLILQLAYQQPARIIFSHPVQDVNYRIFLQIKIYLIIVASKGEAGSPSILYRLAPSGLSAHAYLT
jgi:hypothetical protein